MCPSSVANCPGRGGKKPSAPITKTGNSSNKPSTAIKKPTKLYGR